MNTPTKPNPPANDVCPECRGSGQKPFTGAPYSWVCISCYGTGKAPSIDAKPPLASVDAAPTDAMPRTEFKGEIKEILKAIAPDAGPTPRTDDAWDAYSRGKCGLRYLRNHSTIIERALASARAQLAQMSKDYYDVADAVCKESLSPADASQQARALRTELAAARAELAKCRAERDGLHSLHNSNAKYTEELRKQVAELKGQKL